MGEPTADLDTGPSGSTGVSGPVTRAPEPAPDAVATVTVSTPVLDELLADVTDVVVVLDAGGHVAYVSPGVRRLLGLDSHALVGRGFTDLVHPDDAGLAATELRDRHGRREHGTRLRVHHADEGWHEVIVLARTDRVAGGARWRVLVMRDGEDRRHKLDALRHRLAFEDLLARVASSFIYRSAHEIDGGIAEALADIGSFVGVERAYVYVVDDSRATVEMIHGWDADETRAMGRRHACRQDDVPQWMSALRRLEPIYIPRVADLGPEWRAEQRLLEGQGVKSALAVPLADEGRLIGFIGFDSLESERIWSDDHVSVLNSAAGLISQVLARSDADQRFGFAFARAPLGMSLVGPTGEHLQVNAAYCELTGRTPDELLGRVATEIMHPDDREAVLEAWRTFLDGETDRVTTEMRFVKHDGTTVLCRAHGAAVRSTAGSLRYLVSHYEDITERRAAELDLAMSEERYRTLVENSPAVVTRFDRDCHMIYMSPAVEQFADLGIDEAASRTVAMFGGRDRHPAWRQALQRVIDTGERLDTEWEIPLGDQSLWFQSRAVPEFDQNGEVVNVLVMNTDITALKRTEAELAHQALHDPLTGLANRSLLLDHLRSALVRRERHEEMLAVLFIDLDRFKVVNDSLGHDSGDRLLRSVAQRLTRELRPSDTIARLGGDEFVLVLESLDDPHEPVLVAQRVRQALRRPVKIDGEEVYTSGSIGIAVALGEGVTAEGLLRDADAAMYLAKARGRDRYELFDEDLRRVATERLRLESQLRRAVALGEIEVHYQPEIDLATGQVVGAEALARWRHPSMGLLEATEFIELAEETGVIIELGTFVLRTACRQAGEWARTLPDRSMIVRVNLSARQIAQPDLVDTVVDALDQAGLGPSSLCLEITETALMSDARAGLEVLEALRALGVELAVDDFGTGYSSLAYLKRFPVGVVKVDRSFVDGLGTDPDDTAIVTAIIGLARALGLKVAAEGVETECQLAELVRLGCDRAQGFYFSRAVPSVELDVVGAVSSPAGRLG